MASATAWLPRSGHLLWLLVGGVQEHGERGGDRYTDQVRRRAEGKRHCGTPRQASRSRAVVCSAPLGRGHPGQVACANITTSQWLPTERRWTPLPPEDTAADAAAPAPTAVLLTGDVPSARVGASLTRVGDRLFLFGGMDALQRYGRQARGAARLGSTPLTAEHRARVFGGAIVCRPLCDLYEAQCLERSDGTVELRWTRWMRPDATAAWPSARESHVAVEAQGTLLIHGGRGAGGRLGDLWRLDVGTRAWTQRAVDQAGPFVPPPRSHHAACMAGHLLIVSGGWIAAGAEAAATAAVAGTPAVPGTEGPRIEDDDEENDEDGGNAAKAQAPGPNGAAAPAAAAKATALESPPPQRIWECSRLLFVFDTGTTFSAACCAWALFPYSPKARRCAAGPHLQ